MSTWGSAMSRRCVPALVIAACLVACDGVAADGGDALVSAIRDGNEAVRLLLRRTRDVNQSTPDGTTALHWAVRRDDLETVDWLIKAGADVNRTNRYGVAPLWLACINGNGAVVER